MIRTLLNHSLVYGLTHISARATLLVSLLVLPHLLSPVAYGALAMLTLLGYLAGVVVPLQVAQGLARQLGGDAPPDEKRRYASSAWWFTVAAVLGFFALGQLFAGPATKLLLGDAGFVPAFRIAVLVILLNILFFFLQSQFRWLFRPTDFVVVSLLYSLLTLTLSLGLAWASPDPLLGVVVGQATGAGVAVAWAAWRLRDSLFAGIDRTKLAEMLRFAAPLVPAALAVMLTMFASRIVLNDKASLADVGVFVFANQIAAIGSLTIVGVQAAMSPLITVHHAEPGTREALGRVFEAFCAAALLICLLLGLFAAEAISWLGNPQYARAAPLVLLLAPAVLLADMYVFAPGFWLAKRTDLQAIVSVGAAALAFALGYALIEAMGILGAAVATLAATALFFAAWWRVSGRFYPVPVRWAPLAAYVVAGGGFGVAALLAATPGTVTGVALKAAALAATAGLALATGLVRGRDAVMAARSLLARPRSAPAAPPT